MSVVSIGSNISSLKAQRRLSEGTSDLSKTFERLSSGMRINRASDDAAGLSISESLRTDRRVFNQAVRNLNDGVSLLAIADSAIENLSGIVIRLKELAEQSANGTYGMQQRKALDAEAQALSKEYFRISRSTEFNGLSLFTGNLGELRLQAGYGTDGSIISGLGGAIGTGTFQEAVTYLMESSRSYSVALGDLNGDGILDMISSGTGAGGGRATVRLGAGDGTFGLPVSYLMEGTESYAITLGDLNGDGILDMVSAGVSSGTGRATVRLGTGDGTFGTAVSYLMESSTTSGSVTLGDLNGDGILDMVSSGSSSGGRVTVRLGTGDGTFGAVVSYSMEGDQSHSVTLGDLNGDGILDMVSSGRGGGGGRTTIRLGAGDGTFGAAVSHLMEGYSSFSVTLGDLNGDGIPDMVSSGSSGSEASATVRFGLGAGTFGAAVSYLMDGGGYATTLGDLNGDGILDMVNAGYGPGGRVVVRLGAGDGTFGTAVSYNTGVNFSAFDVALGDINQDGVIDMVAAGYNLTPFSGRAATFLSNTQSGVSPLLPFDLTTRAGALQALPVFSQKLDQLAKQRGTIGAFQSRIEVAVNTLQVASENSAAAASRITDVDVADESSRLTRLNILQQAASSVLAQANLQPQIALTLLR